MKTALFLGAGASVFVEKPTTKELFKELPTHFKSNLFVSNILNHSSFLDIEYLYTAVNDLIDLEHSPESTPITSKYRLNPNLAFNELLPKLKQLQSDMRDLILDRYSVDQSHTKLIEHVYHPISIFLRMTGSEHFQIITTNYDNVIDIFARSHGHSNIVDGFEKTSDPYTSIWANNFTPLNDESIYLLKLHGSITWYKNNGKIFQTGGVIRRDEKDDVIIAPTLTEKNYEREPFSSLIKQFRKILGEIDVLIVIGFSFRDKELTKMIKNAVDSRRLRVISISLNSSGDIDRHFGAKPLKLDSITSPRQIHRHLYYSLDTKFDPDSLDKIIKILESVYYFLGSKH